MKRFSLASLSLLFIACSSPKTEVPAVQTSSIGIPSAQCDMCAKTITTALNGVEGVSDVKVNMDDHKVSVQYAGVSLSSLESAIAKVGYHANNTKRDSAAYQQLEDCCKE